MVLVSSRKLDSDSCLSVVSGILVTLSEMELFIPERKRKTEEMENINSILCKKITQKSL